ncbi:AsnC family protein [Pantoea ananatis]
MTHIKPLDRTDIRILEHLQREGRCSIVELAEAISLSPSPLPGAHPTPGAERNYFGLRRQGYAEQTG